MRTALISGVLRQTVATRENSEVTHIAPASKGGHDLTVARGDGADYSGGEADATRTERR